MLRRFDQLTDYVHSVDVDKNGVAWASGAGGVRGYWTRGRHYDPVKKVKRTAKKAERRTGEKVEEAGDKMQR